MTQALLTGEEGDADAAAGSNAERGDDPGSDALACLDERAAAVRDEQLEQARSRLAARDALTPEAERVLEDVAERLLADLLDAPERAIAEAGDEATEERVRELFCSEE